MRFSAMPIGTRGDRRCWQHKRNRVEKYHYALLSWLQDELLLTWRPFPLVLECAVPPSAQMSAQVSSDMIPAGEFEDRSIPVMAGLVPRLSGLISLERSALLLARWSPPAGTRVRDSSASTVSAALRSKILNADIERCTRMHADRAKLMRQGALRQRGNGRVLCARTRTCRSRMCVRSS